MIDEATPRPWNLHASYDGQPINVTDDLGASWVAAKLIIARGNKIIGYVEVCTSPTPGFPRVLDLAEMRANAELIVEAVNNYDQASPE